MIVIGYDILFLCLKTWKRMQFVCFYGLFREIQDLVVRTKTSLLGWYVPTMSGVGWAWTDPARKKVIKIFAWIVVGLVCWRRTCGGGCWVSHELCWWFDGVWWGGGRGSSFYNERKKLLKLATVRWRSSFCHRGWVEKTCCRLYW